MPKKKRNESEADQSARFQTEAQKLVDAGELNPAEAEAALDRLVKRSRAIEPCDPKQKV